MRTAACAQWPKVIIAWLAIRSLSLLSGSHLLYQSQTDRDDTMSDVVFSRTPQCRTNLNERRGINRMDTYYSRKLQFCIKIIIY
jgi:hypothetical protein